MSASNQAVFLSYASQDAEAAKRICDALRAAGVEVWFDQSELRGGDAWDAKIRKQIKECALFVPVISANTQARTEGYFRLEWRLADQRTHLMSHDRAFLLPVTIDATNEQNARVPESFLVVQWTPARDDATAMKFAERVRTLLHRGPETTSGSGAAGGVPPIESTSAVRHSRRGRGIALAVTLAVLGGIVAVWRPWRSSATAAPVSEARKFVERARAVFEAGDLTNRETYVLTETLLKKAEDFDVTDAEAWALHAAVSRWMVAFGLDISTERKEAMRLQAERAVKLAPTSVSARLAYATMLLSVGGSTDEAEQILQPLLVEFPNDWRVLLAGGYLYRRKGQPEEAAAVLQRARQLSDDHQAVTGDLLTVLVTAGRYAEAEVVGAETLARKSNGRVLEFDVRLKLNWRGDAAAAAAALERWPAWMLNEDRGVQCAAEVWMWNRQPAKALAVLARFPRDMIRHGRFTGPRDALTAWLHEQAGNTQAARADWKRTIQVAEKELAVAPAGRDALHALHWKAWALARLGDQAAAKTILRELIERNENSFRLNETTVGLAALGLVVGDTDWALAELKAIFSGATTLGFVATRAVLDLNPCFDTVRDDPRFKAIRAAAPAPEAVKTSAVSSLSPDPKSVAVLPFANLSGDPAQEFFSDGVTEEILDALARERDLRVPGRASSFAFKETKSPATEIARALGVARLVEGSVRKSGRHVKISVRLTRGSDGFSESLGNFEQELSDGPALFALQDQVARAVVEKLTRRASLASSVVPTKSQEAYDAYLRGRALQLRSGPQNRDAIAFYEKAVALDPNFALGWTRLAEARLRPVQGLWDVGAETITHTKEAIDRALELDSNLALAFIVRANWHSYGHGDLAAAQQDLDRAAALQPNSAELSGAQMRLAFDRGDWAAMARHGRECLALDPQNGDFTNAVGVRFAMMGDYAEADRLYARAISIQGEANAAPLSNRGRLRVCWRGPEAALRLLDRVPAAWPGRDSTRAWVLLCLGRREEARSLLEHQVQNPGASFSRNLQAIAFAGLGELAQRQATETREITRGQMLAGNRAARVRRSLIEAEIVLGHLEAAGAALAEWDRDAKALPGTVRRLVEFNRYTADLFAWMGDADRALALLEEEMDHGYQRGLEIKYDPAFAGLRANPRFQALVARGEAWAKAQRDPLDD